MRWIGTAGKSGWNRVLTLAILFPLVFSGCIYSRPAPVSLLHEAQALGADNRWTDARALVKQYLLDHPEDVAGHYLLGLSYLHVPDDYEIHGRGELLVAYRLFARDGDLGILAEEMDPDAFRVQFHLRTALTYMRSIRRMLMADVPGYWVASHLREALRHVELGLEIEPDNAFLLEMQETLASSLTEVEGQPAEPAPPPIPLAPLPRQVPLV